VVGLEEDFLGPGTASGHALGSGGRCCGASGSGGTSEVDSATPEMERARDATHSAVALRRAPTGGKT
jgi:hypothetical protein